MRWYIEATESLMHTDEPESVIQEAVTPPPATALLEDLNHMVFKLRAFMETSDGDYALGVETGLQRAAEMLENVIRRHATGE